MYSAGYNRGLGFENTFSDQTDQSFDPVSLVSNWDWHEWALAGIVAFVAFRMVTSGAKKAARLVAKPLQRKKARRKRIAEARKRYDEALSAPGLFG